MKLHRTHARELCVKRLLYVYKYNYVDGAKH
jgi:hypothetical protein